MKILIAYDGSDCAEAALDDLQRAGLPREAEAVILSVADVYPLPPSSQEEKPPQTAFERQIAAAREKAHTHAIQALDKARTFAAQASTRVQASFPAWRVSAEACADSPAWGIIKKADDWDADLIVVGAHSGSAVSRMLLGSVSQKVLHESGRTVRIARGRVVEPTAPVRLIVGVDGSPDADTAIGTIAERVWRPGSEVRVVVVLDATLLAAALDWISERQTTIPTAVQTMAEAAAEKLRAAGLSANVVSREGDPKHVLLEEAERWDADAIFLGAHGLRRLERLLLGSVATAVAARAMCSVEIVRGKPEKRG